MPQYRLTPIGKIAIKKSGNKLGEFFVIYLAELLQGHEGSWRAFRSARGISENTADLIMKAINRQEIPYTVEPGVIKLEYGDHVEAVPESETAIRPPQKQKGLPADLISADNSRIHGSPSEHPYNLRGNVAASPAWADRIWSDRYGHAAEFAIDGISFVLRWIPPGRFMMGLPRDEIGRNDDEGPEHLVTGSRGFWMGETPVSQAQWCSLVRENGSRFHGNNQRPVERVSWYQSVAFIKSLNEQLPELGATLPTEAQWEYACRAGSRSPFNADGAPCTQLTSNDSLLNQLGWYEENSGGQTHEVKHRDPNAWGLYDMHGNVWEWCLDGKRLYDNLSQQDPTGPMNEGVYRV